MSKQQQTEGIVQVHQALHHSRPHLGTGRAAASLLLVPRPHLLMTLSLCSLKSMSPGNGHGSPCRTSGPEAAAQKQHYPPRGAGECSMDEIRGRKEGNRGGERDLLWNEMRLNNFFFSFSLTAFHSHASRHARQYLRGARV